MSVVASSDDLGRRLRGSDRRTRRRRRTNVLMVGLSSSGWVQMGMRASPATLLLALPPLLLMVFAFHRLYQVVRWPRTLDSPPVSGIAALARTVGVGLVYLV